MRRSIQFLHTVVLLLLVAVMAPAVIVSWSLLVAWCRGDPAPWLAVTDGRAASERSPPDPTGTLWLEVVVPEGCGARGRASSDGGYVIDLKPRRVHLAIRHGHSGVTASAPHPATPVARK